MKLIACLVSMLPAISQGQALPDSSQCAKVPIRIQQSCIEVSIDRKSGPRFLPSCLQEIELAMQEIDELEQCIAEAMDKRHQEERKDLAESMALRRSMILSNLYSTLR